MAELVMAIGTSHSPVLALDAPEWEARAINDRANQNLYDTDGVKCSYDQLQANFENLKQQMGKVNDESIQLESLERDATVNRNLLEAMLLRARPSMILPTSALTRARMLPASERALRRDGWRGP